jgi:hypothetical protein
LKADATRTLFYSRTQRNARSKGVIFFSIGESKSSPFSIQPVPYRILLNDPLRHGSNIASTELWAHALLHLSTPSIHTVDRLPDYHLVDHQHLPGIRMGHTTALLPYSR